MRVRRALVLGSVLVLFQNALAQVVQPERVATAEENIMFPATLDELNIFIDHPQECQPADWASDCVSGCSHTDECAGIPGLYIECLRTDDGCCQCLDHYQCLQSPGATCTTNCHNEDECQEPGHVCKKTEEGCCKCVPEPDCQPNSWVPQTCPNTCTIDKQCEDPGHSCQRNPCGGCHCYIDHTQDKDCCYVPNSGCEHHDCEKHADCKTGLCIPDPNCEGGCVCDVGEGCVNTGGPDCQDQCDFDEDCRWLGPGSVCQKNLCGGCRCVNKQIEKIDCCPDILMQPYCTDECDYHEQCQHEGNLSFCMRNDCGGCECQLGYSPAWADCWSNPWADCGQNTCTNDSECPGKWSSCKKTKGCCSCQDSVVVVDDVASNDEPPVP